MVYPYTLVTQGVQKKNVRKTNGKKIKNNFTVSLVIKGVQKGLLLNAVDGVSIHSQHKAALSYRGV